MSTEILTVICGFIILFMISTVIHATLTERRAKQEDPDRATSLHVLPTLLYGMVMGAVVCGGIVWIWTIEPTSTTTACIASLIYAIGMPAVATIVGHIVIKIGKR